MLAAKKNENGSKLSVISTVDGSFLINSRSAQICESTSKSDLVYLAQ